MSCVGGRNETACAVESKNVVSKGQVAGEKRNERARWQMEEEHMARNAMKATVNEG